jgi:predicted N-acetyltransferase YhbS
MNARIRHASREDAEVCGEICYRAFRDIAEQHNFPPDFLSVDFARAVVGSMISTPGVYGIVAELDGRIAGSNFMDERSPIAGIGPISVDPEIQNSGAGRQMMLHMLERVAANRFAGVRLVQTAYHNRSFSLYAKLGFEIREPLAVMSGPALNASIPGYTVRRASEADASACNQICFDAHGHNRDGELRAAIKDGHANVVEHVGRISGYSTVIGFGGHTVAQSNQDLKALISAARAFVGPGFLVPARNGDLLRWCYSQGLRLTQLMTLMSVGLYTEPRLPFLTSVLF